MVASFRKAKEEVIEKDKEKFNKKMGRPCVISEHCIGILKGQFPWLRSICMKITDNPESVKLILRLMDATVILHNMLIDFGKADKQDWIDCEEFSDLDDDLCSPFREGDPLNRAIHPATKKDRCQTQLLQCFQDNVFH